MTKLAKDITEILKELFSDARKKKEVLLHEPNFNGNELKYVKECIDTNWVSSAGKYVDRFECELAAFLGAKNVIVAVNGTAALHLCLLAAEIGEGDEVLVPALTFVATANAVVYTNAVPHFVDIAENSMGICPVKLENYLNDIADIKNKKCINKKTGRTIKAIIPMHTFGHPVDMDKINVIARKFNLVVIEDAAESLGSEYKGKMTGTISRLAAISFNGNKIITTGGGGAVITDDDKLAHKVKHLSTTAKVKHHYRIGHDEIGYNYRMPNINAALGVAQLENIGNFLEKKRSIAESYEKAFANVQGVKFIKEPSYAKSNYWLNAIKIEDVRQLEGIIVETGKAGFMTRPVWDLMTDLPMYKNMPCMDISVARNMVDSVINLPSSSFLKA